MRNISITWAESLAQQSIKFFRTISYILFDQRKIFKEVQSRKFPDIISPWPFFIFSNALMIVCTRYTTLTHSFAPWYSTWAHKMNTSATEMIPPEILFFVWPILCELLILFAFSMLMPARHRKLILSLLLYCMGMGMYLKLFFMGIYLMLFHYCFGVNLNSSLSVSTLMIYFFRYTPYFLFLVLIAAPAFCQTKNTLAQRLVPYLPKIKNPKFAYLTTIIFLISSMALANFLLDMGNNKIYTYYKALPTNQPIGFLDLNMNNGALEFLCERKGKDSTIIKTDFLVYSNETGNTVPLSSNGIFVMLDNTYRTNSWALSHSCFTAKFADAVPGSSVLTMDPDKYYPLHLEATISNKVMNYYVQTFHNQDTEVGLMIFRKEAEFPKLKKTRKKIIIKPSKTST